MMCDDLNLEAGVRPLSLCLGALFVMILQAITGALKKLEFYQIILKVSGAFNEILLV